MAHSSAESSEVEQENVHLFLFIHGLWGNPSHMSTIEKAVKKSVAQVSSDRIVTLKPSSFRFWKTYDGIQRCSESVIADLLYEIETLKVKNKCKVTKISILGYSLGGLISRFVAGSLYELGFFEEVCPVFFTTFATPHIGVHFFKDAIFDKFANRMGTYLFGKTGFELFLADSEKLLVEMTKHDSTYIKGLRLFQKRILLANIRNDRSVPFFTSFITEFSPFESLNSIKIRYFEDTPPAKVNGVTVWPKFVDLKRSDRIVGTEVRHQNVQEATSILRSNIFIRYTLLVFAALVLFPFYLPLIICLSSYVSCYSIVKVKLVSGPNNLEHWAGVRQSVYHGGSVDIKHAEQGDSRRKERKKLSRHESFKGDTSNMTENAMEQMLAAEERLGNESTDIVEEEVDDDNGQVKDEANNVLNKDSLPYTSDVSESDNEDMSKNKADKLSIRPLFPLVRRSTAAIDIPVEEYDKVIRKHESLLAWDKSQEYPLFQEDARLSFSEDQATIAKNLNDLDWIKIPVYHDSFNAHDSIVARRGAMRNPKGTCTIFLWASILRVHMLENDEE